MSVLMGGKIKQVAVETSVKSITFFIEYFEYENTLKN